MITLPVFVVLATNTAHSAEPETLRPLNVLFVAALAAPSTWAMNTPCSPLPRICSAEKTLPVE